LEKHLNGKFRFSKIFLLNKKTWKVPIQAVFIISFGFLFFNYFDNLELNSLKIPGYKSIALVIMLRAAHFYLSLKISLILISIISKNVTIFEIFLINTITHLTKLLGPLKIGFIVKVQLLKQKIGLLYQDAISLSVIIQVLTFALLSLFALLNLFIVEIHVLQNEFLDRNYFFIFIVIILFFTVAFLKLEKKINILPIFNFYQKIQINQIIKISLIYVAGLFFNPAIMMILLFDFGYKIDLHFLFGVNCITKFLGALSLIPFGAGVEDITILSILIENNIDSGSALSVVLILRILNTGISLVLGFFSLSYMILKN
tara:strand:+ start:34 stop:978 length:945 start_codon:yes stop_codon:yes gene_type:complete